MRRNPITSKLTKDFIESKVSQEAIVSKYLGIPMDVVKDCIANNRLIESVFRDDDRNKSMGIQYNAKGKLKVRDFGGFGFFEDIYGVVAYVLSIAYERQIDTNNKKDFYFILQHIASTFSDIVEGKAVDENINKELEGAISKAKSKKVLIDIVPRSWNKDDKALWNKWHIDLNYLNTHFVVPVEQYYLNRTYDSEPKYYYKAKDPCYAYMLGKNRQGVYLIKLYFPLRDRNKQHKFITNCNVLEGLPNLELDNYDYIIITKSSKDRLCIGNHLINHPLYGGSEKLNIGIINVPSENYELNDVEYEYLVNKLSPNGIIFSFFDFDTTGRKGARYLKETYGIPYIFITRGEFGLYNYRAKDFSDLCELYSVKDIINFVNETKTYVELKYKTQYSCDSDASFQGLSDYRLPY